MDLFIQAIGFMGLFCFLISYQMKSNKVLFLLQLIGSALFCSQFFLMSALSGCLSLALNMVRNALLYKQDTFQWAKSKWVAVFLCFLFAIVLLITWDGPISLLAFTASVVSTVGYWTNNARNIRLSNLLCASPCWMTYDILVGSWGGIISEGLTMLSILVSIYRFGWKALGENQQM